MCYMHLFYIVIYFKFSSKICILVKIGHSVFYHSQRTLEVTFWLSLSHNIVIFTFFTFLFQLCGCCVHVIHKHRNIMFYAVIEADMLERFFYIHWCIDSNRVYCVLSCGLLWLDVIFTISTGIRDSLLVRFVCLVFTHTCNVPTTYWYICYLLLIFLNNFDAILNLWNNNETLWVDLFKCL